MTLKSSRYVLHFYFHHSDQKLFDAIIIYSCSRSKLEQLKKILFIFWILFAQIMWWTQYSSFIVVFNLSQSKFLNISRSSIINLKRCHCNYTQYAECSMTGVLSTQDLCVQGRRRGTTASPMHLAPAPYLEVYAVQHTTKLQDSRMSSLVILRWYMYINW